MGLAESSYQPYFDQRIKGMSIFVLPGNHYAQKSGDNAISTLLGSCVAACIRDTKSQIGGLNHFLLPDGGGSDGDHSARYGVNAMEVLINDILKMGAVKSNLEAKVFGGGNVIPMNMTETVGDRNGKFVRDFLASEGIPVRAADLGGDRARRVYFFPSTGKVSVLNVAPSDRRVLQSKEKRMQEKVLSTQATGSVELF